MNKFLKTIIVLTILLLVFRGLLYRTSVNYSKVRVRENIRLAQADLKQVIDAKIGDKTLSIEEIIQHSQTLTSEKLTFTFNKASSNPNNIFISEKANCIGYSSLFNAIGNYILLKQQMTDRYEFKHLVGKLTVFGCDVHALIDSPFFKDHDYNEIRNKQTGTKIYVDPSIHDYFNIDTVTSKQ